MSKRIQHVPARTVRAWATAENIPTGTRGRLNPAVATAFNAAMIAAGSKERYVPKVAEVDTVDVTITALNKLGRKYRKTVTVTHAEARAALGQSPDTRGRFPMRRLAEALSEASA